MKVLSLTFHGQSLAADKYDLSLHPYGVLVRGADQDPT